MSGGVSIGNKYVYLAYSFTVHPIPEYFGLGKLELEASANLRVFSGMSGTGIIDLFSEADLTVLTPAAPISFVDYGTKQLPGSDVATITMAIPTVQTGDKVIAAILHSYALEDIPDGWKLVRAYDPESPTPHEPTFASIAFVSDGVTRYMSIFEFLADASDSAENVVFDQGTSGRMAGQLAVVRSDDGGEPNIDLVRNKIANNLGSTLDFHFEPIVANNDGELWMGWVGMVRYNNTFVDFYQPPDNFTYLPPALASTGDNRLVGAYYQMEKNEEFEPTFTQAFGNSIQGYGSIAMRITSVKDYRLQAHGVLDLLSPSYLTAGEKAADELLATYTISNQSSVDIPIASYASNYDQIEIEVVGVIPTNNNRDLSVRVSADGGSTFDSGSGAYAYAHGRVGSGVSPTTSVSGSAVLIPVNTGNGARNLDLGGISGRIMIAGFDDATKYPMIMYDMFVETDDHRSVRMWGAGMRKNAQATTDIQLFFSDGMKSGTIKVIGKRK